MKLLIITIIALVIPFFFVLVFVMSTVSKLTRLRNRCREIRKRVPDTRTGSEMPSAGRSDFNLAVEQYNAARTKLPAKLLAACCGFSEMEPLPNHPVEGRREGF